MAVGDCRYGEFYNSLYVIGTCGKLTISLFGAICRLPIIRLKSIDIQY